MEIHLRKFMSIACALLLNAADSQAQLNVCGKPPLNNKIVGGADATAGSWPWQVSITRNGNHFCGGSLITEEWVLSAAHCFQSFSASEIRIRIGLRSLQLSDSNMEERNVRNIISHPDYNSETFNNDIALLQLSSSLSFTNFIMPVCLAASGFSILDGSNVWVTGWGTINFGVNLPSPQTLQEVQVPIVSNGDCANAYGNIITNNMICAGLQEGGKDSCQGDSGGPMVVKINGTWAQIGIVSFGNGCAQPNFPGVYARVSQYNDWISSRIGGTQPGFVFGHGNRGSPNLFCLFLSFFTTPFLLSFSMF